MPTTIYPAPPTPVFPRSVLGEEALTRAWFANYEVQSEIVMEFRGDIYSGYTVVWGGADQQMPYIDLPKTPEESFAGVVDWLSARSGSGWDGFVREEMLIQHIAYLGTFVHEVQAIPKFADALAAAERARVRWSNTLDALEETPSWPDDVTEEQHATRVTLEQRQRKEQKAFARAAVAGLRQVLI